MNQSIVACGNKFDIGRRVVLWTEKSGFRCPHPRGRTKCLQHDPSLNDQPTQKFSNYRILEPGAAYEQLQSQVHQLILHYDACYCAQHCHDVLKDSTFKGSHFYLDLDGTLYQTCDLYWKTNTAPADDGLGNERSVHVEMANLSWEALKKESTLYDVECDQYQKKQGGWQLMIPEKYRQKIQTKNFEAFAARSWGERGYFSRRINGKIVRMWDFTEHQYQTLFALCLGINNALPRIRPQVPYDPQNNRTPLGRIKNFKSFEGILGHAHVQGGTSGGPQTKYDPGSAFNWPRLRKTLTRAETIK